MSSAFPLRPLRSSVSTLYVILGDQLDHESPVLELIDRERDAVLMMELKEESTHAISHTQRTVMFLSAMRHYAVWLRDQGFRVQYIRLDDEANTHCFSKEVARQAELLKAERLVAVEPGEHRVRSLVEDGARQTDCELRIIDDTHFLTTPDEFAEWAEGRKQLTMENFYRVQRRRLGMLMDGDQPLGGKWNYDADNRDAFKTTPRSSGPPVFEPDAITAEVIAEVEKRLPNLPGSADSFNWPVTREQAMESLDRFIDDRLGRFGRYEDAMWTNQRTLYHSRLSAAINLHLLSPRECADRAIEALDRGDAPLNSVEGFVRQLIGWREFIRGVYFLEGQDYNDRNALEADGALPELYWTGETDMACMSDCVGSVVEDAYAHHIPRLMVMGNFAMLAGVRPSEVHAWYLGMFADGVDWATSPNVIGMALHADGGVVGTKPYAASGKYISRMSNYCENCRFDVRRRTGEDACPFNTLYWDYLIRHRERFRSNHRMSMILANVDKMDPDERVEITVNAESIRDRLGVIPSGS